MTAEIAAIHSPRSEDCQGNLRIADSAVSQTPKSVRWVLTSDNVLMATLARLLLEGHAWQGSGDLGRVTSPIPAMPRPPLMEAHHASDDLAALYADLRGALGLPFVNTDYRAFARWPSYSALPWSDLKPRLSEVGYATRVECVHQAAITLAVSLPNASGITPDALRDAATSDASL